MKVTNLLNWLSSLNQDEVFLLIFGISVITTLGYGCYKGVLDFFNLVYVDEKSNMEVNHIYLRHKHYDYTEIKTNLSNLEFPDFSVYSAFKDFTIKDLIFAIEYATNNLLLWKEKFDIYVPFLLSETREKLLVNYLRQIHEVINIKYILKNYYNTGKTHSELYFFSRSELTEVFGSNQSIYYKIWDVQLFHFNYWYNLLCCTKKIKISSSYTNISIEHLNNFSVPCIFDNAHNFIYFYQSEFMLSSINLCKIFDPLTLFVF